MSPYLAAFLPLIILIGLALIAYLAVGAYSIAMLLHIARGELEPDDTEEESDIE